MYKNETNIPITIAVWLASDGDYDLKPDANVISATTLLRPLRSIVLSRRIEEQGEIDVDDVVASKLGSATHTSIEQAWLTSYREALKALGHPEGMIESIALNPEKNEPDKTNIYIERRTAKEIDGFVISGKFDFVVDGVIHDIKTTKTYTYISGSNNEDYRKQASIYRWLNSKLATEDYFYIDYIFTNWSPLEAKAKSDYPPARCVSKKFQLASLEETEMFIRKRIQDIKYYDPIAQEDLPECGPLDLWQSPTTWAYYKDVNKTTRATKLFDNHADALRYSAGRGMIIERKGEVRRCTYCNAKSICLQADKYRAEGRLKE